MEQTWHALDATEVCKALGVDPNRGHTNDAAQELLGRYGPNELPTPPGPSVLKRILRQFADPLVGALLVAAGISVAVALAETAAPGTSALARFGDTIAIVLIVLLNAALGFFQERRAESALAALKRMASPRAVVVREARATEIDARELVPGDVVRLEAGSAVAADVRLVDSAEFAVDESALTGESVPVDKEGGLTLEQSTPVSDQTNMAFLGTLATRGQATAVVVRTGAGTELGRIGALIQAAPESETPLETRINQLGRWILFACVAISTLLLVIGLVRGNQPWQVLLLTAVSLAVAAIPEGLPAITTITLALGVQRMARDGAVIRRLPAVETLGSATVICTDKTGTVTENRMRVKRIEGIDSEWEWENQAEATPPPVLKDILETVVVCNTADLGDAEADHTGDPMEIALLQAARETGMERQTVLHAIEVVQTIPFDSERKYMAVAVRTDETPSLVWHVKGSPEALLPRCTSARTESGERAMADDARQRVLARTDALADDGLRVLAVARGHHGDSEDLTFLGLVALHDPPRREAADAITVCHHAGIRVVMITGDHPRTAIAIAKALGLWHARSASLTGSELTELSPEQLQQRLESISVFARVSPEQKLDIVRALIGRGNVVAMTGDGVNDAPALKEAQIGISMGLRGTEVARQASEMVLADDNFATIVKAIREGRAIFSNIQKFVFFLNSSNAGLVIAVIVGSFFDALPHLTPLQLLWINLVTNGLPALALGLDPPDPGQMDAPPRTAHQGLFGWREAGGVLYVGAIMGGAALWVSALPMMWPEPFAPTAELAQVQAQTMAFTVLALSPLFHAFNARSPRYSVMRRGLSSNRLLWLAVLISGTLQLAAVAVGPLHAVFKTTPLSLIQWGIVLALAALPLPSVEFAKWIGRMLSNAKSRTR